MSTKYRKSSTENVSVMQDGVINDNASTKHLCSPDEENPVDDNSVQHQQSMHNYFSFRFANCKLTDLNKLATFATISTNKSSA